MPEVLTLEEVANFFDSIDPPFRGCSEGVRCRFQAGVLFTARI